MGRTKVIFLCPHLTKSRFPAGPLLQLPSKSSWPPALIYWALEGGSCLQKTVLNVCRHGGLNPSVQKLPDLRTRTRTKDGPRSCSAPTSGWALGHRWTLPTLQTLRTTITKRLNEVDSTKQDSLLQLHVENQPNKSVLNSEPFQRYCQDSRHQEQCRKVKRRSNSHCQTLLLQTYHF